MTDERVAAEIVDAAVKLHADLGPGLFESVYEVVLKDQLERRGLEVQRQVVMPIEYKGIRFDEGFRVDLIVEGLVLCELKACEAIHPAHRRQLVTYLRLSGRRLGLLLNFGSAMMKNNIARIVSEGSPRSRDSDR